MGPPVVRATWTATAAESEGAVQELLARVEEKPLGSDPQSIAAELTLGALPWRLVRGDDVEDGSAQCELRLDFGERALQCKVLQLQVSSSARHVELYVDGVRRNLLGEDERSDVYLGTFRGTKQDDRFDVTQEFKQTTHDHDVLKKIHRLRIKFVSLVGDKNVLELASFRCLYIAAASPPASQATGPMGGMPSAADMMGMMAGLSIGGQAPGVQNPQAILLMVHQMMEREVEAKITQALDAKLSVLAQRLAFSEQMLMQVQQKSAAKDAQLEQKLETLQQQLADLRGDLADKKTVTETAQPDEE